MKRKSEFKIQYMPIGMSIGISIGLVIGASLQNIPICMAIGLSIGLCVGVVIDYINNNKKTKRYRVIWHSIFTLLMVDFSSFNH